MRISVFIENLSAYNSGYLVGKWWNVPVNSSEVAAHFEAARERGIPIGEEWMIADFDFEVDLPCVREKIYEYMSISELNELWNSIEEIASERGEKFIKAATEVLDLDEVIKKYEDIGFYPDQSLEDVAQEFFDIDVDIPDWVRDYLDVGKYARDLEDEGYYESSYGVIRLCC